jgi:hypothetical protein
MRESSRDLEFRANHWLGVLERNVEGFRPIQVRRDDERVCLVFRWHDDPNTYEICSAIAGGTWSMPEFDWPDLMEELDTGFLMGAVKSRSGSVLRADWDGKTRGSDNNNFYLSAVLGSVGHLAFDGLDTGPGLAARNAGTLLHWWAGYANTRTGYPTLGQLVVVRDSDREAHIEHLELSPKAGDDLGHDLVFTAIHHAARRGIHRLYSPASLVHVAPFEFDTTAARPNALVYDITTRDMNWPARLNSNASTRTPPIVDEAHDERTAALGETRYFIGPG